MRYFIAYINIELPGAKVIIKSLVVFTYCPLKVIDNEFNRPGVKVTWAAAVELEVSLPIDDKNGEVVRAEPGFIILPRVIVIEGTLEVEAKALFIVIVKLFIEHVVPDISEPWIITAKHVAPDIRDEVY